MSPQQIRGQRPRPSDDIYSMGATIYSLLTGKPPFYHGDLVVQITNEIAPTMNKRRTELALDEPPIPMEWEETVAACLAKDPDVRPKTMNEVAVQLGVREPSTRRVAAVATPAGERPRVQRRADPSTRRAPVPASPPRRHVRPEVPSALLAAAFLLWPGASGDPPAATDPAPSPPAATSAGAPRPAPPAVLAEIGGLPVIPPASQATLDAIAAEKLAAERRAERAAALRADVARLVRARSWDQAAALLPELTDLAPEDEDVAAWSGTVHDHLGIRDLLDGYRAAQEARDADAYQLLWVGLDETTVEMLRRSYAELSYLSLTIRDLDTRIGASTATLRFRESITFDLQGLGRQKTEARTVLTLQRTASGWRIAARSSEQ